MSKEQVSIDDIIERYPGKPESLIFLLQDIQSAYNYVSPTAMNLVCDHVGIPLTQAYAVATFYKSFSLEPKGEHEIRVCLGTACHLKGGERIAEGLERDLDVERGRTTKDQKFTLETVNCLGACAMAPVVMIDEDYIGGATQGSVRKYLKKFQ
ncbi:MAG: NAD(P)H-dependent oxidoreductase subunit E [Desulfobacterota bacterium]|nr:NAD(P)H-dependent oxidoreductase subunit E [Thermodesulfobacteriota bacterium]